MVDLGRPHDHPTEYGTVQASGGTMLTASNSPLYAYRRRELYLLADAFRVEYSKDAPATEMRALLLGLGIDGKTPPPNPVQAKPKADMTLPYEEWKFLDLRKECKRKGIKFVNTDKKATLLEKLAPPEVIYGQVAT